MSSIMWQARSAGSERWQRALAAAASERPPPPARGTPSRSGVTVGAANVARRAACSVAVLTEQPECVGWLRDGGRYEGGRS